MRAALGWLLLTWLASASAYAQAPAEAAHGLTIRSFEWKYVGYGRMETVRGNESIPNRDVSASIKVSRGKAYVFKYEARATVKNEGAKAVKAVFWEFVFTDAKDGKELKRYRLQSKQQVRPGETQTLSKEVGLEPDDSSRHITSGKQSVELTRIEYADGSVWKKQ